MQFLQCGVPQLVDMPILLLCEPAMSEDGGEEQPTSSYKRASASLLNIT
jgi:hypothetical protein